MSDDTPQPSTPEPDPFEQLLMGIGSDEPATPAADPVTPEDPTEPAQLTTPEPSMPQTEPTLEYGHGPAEPAPTAPTVVFPGAAAADLPQPAPAQQPPSQAAPGWSLGTDAGGAAAGATAATTILPGGVGGPPPGGPTRPTGSGPFGNRKVLMWVLAGVAALLVIALAVLITVLAMNAGAGEPKPTGTPTATTSSTPRPTASRTPTPTPTVMPAIKSFVADPMVVQCANASAVANVSLGWSTVGTTQVAVASAAGLVDAIDNPYQNNLAETVESFSIPYACGNASWAYTLTIAGADGEHRSQVVTVTRLPFPSPTPPPAPPAPTASLSANPTVVTCVEGESAPKFNLEWTSTNGTSASINGPGENAGYDWPSLSPNGTQPEIAYDCAQETMSFTLTVTGQTSPPATASITVTNDGWGPSGG